MYTYMDSWAESTISKRLYNQIGQTINFTKSLTESGIMIVDTNENSSIFVSEQKANEKYTNYLSNGWSTKRFIVNYRVYRLDVNKYFVTYQDANDINVIAEVCNSSEELKQSLTNNFL